MGRFQLVATVPSDLGSSMNSGRTTAKSNLQIENEEDGT